MSTQSIRVVRADLAAVVRRARSGEATVITVGGRPAAQVGPVGSAEAGIDVLIATGAVVAPRRTTPWRAPDPVPIAPGARLDRATADIR